MADLDSDEWERLIKDADCECRLRRMKAKVLQIMLIQYVHKHYWVGSTCSLLERELEIEFDIRMLRYAQEWVHGKRGASIPGWALHAMANGERVTVGELGVDTDG